MFAGMLAKNVNGRIKHFTKLGFGNIEIQRRLKAEGIQISTSSIYRTALKFQDACKREIVIKEFERILTDDCLKLHGKIYKSKDRGIYVMFALDPLRKLAVSNEIRVTPYFSSDYSQLLIKRCQDSKIKLYARPNGQAISLSFGRFVHSNKPFPDKIKIYVPLDQFRISDVETISDAQGQHLFRVLKQRGWSLAGLRCTDRNIYSDLLVRSPGGRFYLVEITHEGKEMRISIRIRAFLRQRMAGKAFLQCAKAEELGAQPVMVLWAGLIENGVLSDLFFKACKMGGVKLIFSAFDGDWACSVARQLSYFDSKQPS